MRNKRIDFINGIGILAVVFGHYQEHVLDPSWGGWIYSWHMPLFFLTGGFLFACKEKGYFKKGFLKYILRSAKGILIPYTGFWFLMVFLRYILKPLLLTGSIDVHPISYFAASYFLTGQYVERVLVPLWFLPTYFITRLAYYLLRKVRTWNNYVYWVLVLAILAGTIPFQRLLPGRPFLCINVVPAGLVFMAIGSLMEDIQKGADAGIKPTVRILTFFEKAKRFNELTVLTLLMISIIVCYLNPGTSISYWKTMLYPAGACCMVGSIALITNYVDSPFIRFCGEESVNILGLHVIVGIIVGRYFDARILPAWEGGLRNFFLVMISVVVTVGIIYCCKRLKGYFLWRLKITATKKSHCC